MFHCFISRGSRKSHLDLHWASTTIPTVFENEGFHLSSESIVYIYGHPYPGRSHPDYLPLFSDYPASLGQNKLSVIPLIPINLDHQASDRTPCHSRPLSPPTPRPSPTAPGGTVPPVPRPFRTGLHPRSAAASRASPRTGAGAAGGGQDASGTEDQKTPGGTEHRCGATGDSKRFSPFHEPRGFERHICTKGCMWRQEDGFWFSVNKRLRASVENARLYLPGAARPWCG